MMPKSSRNPNPPFRLVGPGWRTLWVILAWVLAGGVGAAGCQMVEPLFVPPTVQQPQVDPLPTPTPIQAPEPAALAEIYLQAWQRQDYPAMYAWLSPLSQDAISSEDFTRFHQEIASAMSLESIEYSILSGLARGSSAQVGFKIRYITRLAGVLERTQVMNLLLEDQQWRVAWDRTLILPELAEAANLWLDFRSPSRAPIYDRSGRALVALADAYALGIVAGETNPAQENDLFNEIWSLTGVSPETLLQRLANSQPGWYVPLGEVSASRLETRYDFLANFSGFVLKPYRSRYYFNSGIAPQVVGYLGSITDEEMDTYIQAGYKPDDRVGQMGLERWGEPYLSGKSGGVLYAVTPEGQILTRLSDAQTVPAQAIYTTLDRGMQLGAQQALAGFLGAIVVLERDTGAILALASSPGFDPNLFEPANYNSSHELAAILADPDTPLLNRATQGQYPPGSIFKIVTLAAALESGLYTPNSSYFCGQRFTEIPGLVRYDWTYTFGAPASGQLNLPEALMRSCNPWFWHIGLDFYAQGLTSQVADMARGFGLGSSTGLDQLLEAVGNVATPQNEIDAINLAIGQGDMLVTPLQIARFTAAIGNGGRLLRPQLVDKIVPPGGEPSFTFSPVVQATLPLSPANLLVVQQAMLSVVQNPRGTAYWRFINFPIPIAGKTGTAEAPPNQPHAWFAGYTLAENPDQPDIAIAVVVEHGGEGSVVAAPIFKRMVELYYFGQALSPLPWESVVPQPLPPESAPMANPTSP